VKLTPGAMDDFGPPSSADEAFDMIENISTRVKSAAETVNDFLQLRQKLESAKEFAVDHPTAALFLSVLCVLCIIPVLCFCTFAVCVTVALVASFLFFEAFFLIIGALVLIGVLSFVAFISIGFSALLSLGYYAFIALRTIALKIQTSISAAAAGSTTTLRHRTD